MKYKFFRAICWVLISILAVGIIIDWLVLLGCARSFQYIYNFTAFCVIVALLIPALGDKLYTR